MKGGVQHAASRTTWSHFEAHLTAPSPLVAYQGHVGIGGNVKGSMIWLVSNNVCHNVLFME